MRAAASGFKFHAMKKFSLQLFFVAFSFCATSQTTYVSSGKITYERKMNLWAQMSGNVFEGFKSRIPEYKSDLFSLSFTTEKSLYAPAGEVKKFFISLPANDNIVFTDFTTGKSIASKNVFEKNYLIENGLKDAVWKIKDDFREIAGYNCRRATTILFDSVFVVAFYTDQIIPSAGPESFSGLPGTILGLVINRLHTTWYATRVEIDGIDEKKISPPVKGNKITPAELEKALQEPLKMLGNAAEKMIWAVRI